jgi:acyl-CoA dehydrogenase
MNFNHSERSQALQKRVGDFMDEHVYPVEHLYYEQARQSPHPYRTPPVLQELKARARAEGLWNLFLSGPHGGGLSNLEYAPVKELMGRVLWAPEVFNCSAPDTGNMEVLANYGTPAQQSEWLEPLLAGTIRSAFSMTEPAVAFSDATNIQCEIRRDGDHYDPSDSNFPRRQSLLLAESSKESSLPESFRTDWTPLKDSWSALRRSWYACAAHPPHPRNPGVGSR